MWGAEVNGGELAGQKLDQAIFFSQRPKIPKGQWESLGKIGKGEEKKKCTE